MRRGDLITAVLAGDYGKPRPCLVVQSDRLAKLDSVLLCPLSSEVSTAGPARVVLEPSESNGLRKTSVVMIDKVTALSRSRCRDRIGEIQSGQMKQVGALLAFVLGLID